MTHLKAPPTLPPTCEKAQSSEQPSVVPASAQRNTSWLTEDAFIVSHRAPFPTLGRNYNFFLILVVQLGPIVASPWVSVWTRITSFWRRCSPTWPSALTRSPPRPSSLTVGPTPRRRRGSNACTSRCLWEWRRNPHFRARTARRHNTQPQVCHCALWSHCNTSTITQQPLNY